MKWLLLCLLTLSATAWADAPKIAVFPLGGTSSAAMRDRAGFAMRAKLDRDGAYEPIDGPTMLDMASPANTPVDFTTTSEVIQNLARGSGAAVLVWGDLSPADGQDLLRLNTLDLREKSPNVQSFQRSISDPEHISFVVEAFLQTLPGVTPFTHPSTEAIHHDPASDRLFATNPNLVVDGDFSIPGHWNAIYLSDKYPVAVSDNLPTKDRVAIYRLPDPTGPGFNNVLAMNMSYPAATNNGLACLSDPIDIQPGVRYRLSFRYRSEGPRLQVFVKGYISAKDIAGQTADQEIYRLEVPSTGGTDGKWQTVEADLNPRNPDSPVQFLRVDLYVYLNPGVVMFDDVTLKAIGRQSAPAATQP